MLDDKYDLCVIGGGPAGFAASMRALDFGKKVALIEKSKIGGAGIFNGALSSKTLYQLSVSYKNLQKHRLGFTVLESELRYSAVIDEMMRACNERYVQLKEQLNYFQNHKNIKLFEGHGKIISPTEIVVSNGSHQHIINADKIILAVGSHPRKLPHIPIDEQAIVTSDGIKNFKDFPKSLVILGAGVIGCEFATIFSNFGRTKVYLIDKAERILPFEDEDVAYTIANNLEHNGVHIHRNCSLEKMEIVNGLVQYTIVFNDGRKEIHTVEKALVSVGREVSLDNLGLENIDLKFDDRGNIECEDTVTNYPNICAVGDATADISLVNVAELEARHAVEKLFSKPAKPISYNNISTIMFVNPVVAGAGMNETQAKQKRIAYRMAKIPYDFLNRAIAMRTNEGFIKILVSDDDELKVLGIRAVGRHASSAIDSIGLLISMNKGIHELAEHIHPHPSITEGIQECARMLLGKSILKPEVFSLKMKCYRVSSEGRVEDINRLVP